MPKVANEEVQQIFDNFSNKTEAIKEIKTLLWKNGYMNFSNENRLLFRYSPLIGSSHTVDIDLTNLIKKANSNLVLVDTPPKKESHKRAILPKTKIGFFDKFKMNKITDRANDEILYEYVLSELEQNIKFKGLWAKAYANSEGDENKIEPLYMQYRVQAIKDRLVALEIAYNEMSRKQLFQYIKDKLS